MRDITLEDTIRIGFTTRAFATGVPTILSGTPVLSVLEENNATPITAGVSVSVDRASVTGLNEATIVATAANGYELGKGYSLYISTGTVGGVSVVGEIVGEFTIQASAAAVDLANGTDGLGALKTGIDDVPTVSEFNARTLVAASYFDPAADTVANVTLVATVTTNTDTAATLGSPAGASMSADIADIPTVSEFNARTLAAADYFDPAADAVANVTLVATVTTVTGGATASALADVPTVAEFNARTILSAAYFDPAADTVALVSTVTDVTNDVGANVKSFIGTAISETTAGNLSNNFDTFYDNADALTTKVVDDVGGGAGSTDWSASERNEIRGRLGITGTTAAGGNTPTLALEATLGSPAGASISADIADLPTVAEFEARTLLAASYFDFSTDSVTVGTNNDKTGYSISGTITTLDGLNNLADTDIVTGGAIVTSSGQVSVVTTVLDGAKAAELQIVLLAVLDTPTNLEFNARTILSADYFDPAADAVANVTLVATVTDVTNDVGANVKAFIGTSISESTSGNVADNFDTFYDNADALTAKVVDDVGGGSGLTSQQTRDAMKLAPTAGAPATGSIDEHLDDILEDTNTTIPATIADLPTVSEFNARTLPSGTYFDPAADTVALVTDITNDVGITQAGADKAWSTTTRILTASTNFNDLSAAQVNAEVLDVMNVDTFGELSGVPAATSSIVDKLNWVFAVSRNKTTQTSTLQAIRNDADSGNIATAVVSDDGTITKRNEYS